MVTAKPTPAQKETGTVAELMACAAQAHRGGALPEAAEIYLQALQKQPGLWDAQYLRAVLRSQQGRYTEALALIEPVVKAKPASVAVLTNYASILHRVQRHEEALTFFDQA